MKKIQLYILLAMAGLAINACRPEAHKELGEAMMATTSLSGTWKLSKVIQTDEDAKNKGFTYDAVNVQQMDITNVFPYSDYKLTFNMEGNAPTTFTAVPGNAPKIIGLTSGKWLLDDPNYPKVISMVNGTDTARITLGSYPMGQTPVLKVRQERRDATTGKLLISYSYEFTKQQ